MNRTEIININDIPGFRIGNAEYENAGTGCTVILAEERSLAGCDVRGGAPATRETDLLSSLASNDGVNAVLLSGGSAYGLNAAAGVMKWLEEHNRGFKTADGIVPIVPAACIYDLGYRSFSVRPDEALGYQACENAGNYQDGCFGAGCGATVGKILGPDRMEKAGIGSCAVKIGDFMMGAVVSVNALGDVYDPDTAQKIAGVRADVSAEEILVSSLSERKDLTGKNTTIACIITNGIFTKAEMNKIAAMAHDGYGRAIRPVHTMYDGDAIFTVTSGKVKAEVNAAGALAAMVTARAIANSVRKDR